VPDYEGSRAIDATPDAVWRLVVDPQRLPEWVPTTQESHPEGGGVWLHGESHGHSYDMQSGFHADEQTRQLSWDSPRLPGYRGDLSVAEDGAGSRVTVHLTVPDLPPDADEEMSRGIAEALDRIATLAS
jgi:uncharacterized protein YndB with AHSA1/START domain